jgi:hypothetical protein
MGRLTRWPFQWDILKGSFLDVDTYSSFNYHLNRTREKLGSRIFSNFTNVRTASGGIGGAGTYYFQNHGVQTNTEGSMSSPASDAVDHLIKAKEEIERMRFDHNATYKMLAREREITTQLHHENSKLRQQQSYYPCIQMFELRAKELEDKLAHESALFVDASKKRDLYHADLKISGENNKKLTKRIKELEAILSQNVNYGEAIQYNTKIEDLKKQLADINARYVAARETFYKIQNLAWGQCNHGGD